MSDYQNSFENIVTDPRYVANLDWGEAREGHPEATIRAHIAEIEPNLERLRPRLTEIDYWKLKVLVHTHDTFKGQSKPGVPISDANSHASIARAFLAQYCQDSDLLAMVQWHDEPFAIYRQFETKGRHNKDRFLALLSAIQDWNLFLGFNIIDGCTAGKSREPRIGCSARFTDRSNPTSSTPILFREGQPPAFLPARYRPLTHPAPRAPRAFMKGPSASTFFSNGYS